MIGSATLPAAFASPTGPEGQIIHLAKAAIRQKGEVLNRSRELDRFLAEVERRALRMAQIAVRDAQDALDIVQDAMLQLARRYAARPPDEWKPLFYRILQNRIRDCQRRHTVRSRFMAWWPLRTRDGEEDEDPVAEAPAPELTPGDRVQVDEAMRALERAIADLPQRQQQAFLLRNLEGLDVAETASAMGCSAGSVKTHYFRAVQTLRDKLGAFWS
jgi:RNA polymerase sigma-70 factor (ECF subfamily)